MSRAGGRVFDLDVDIVDPYAAPLLEAVNAMTAQEVAMEQPLEQVGSLRKGTAAAASSTRT